MDLLGKKIYAAFSTSPLSPEQHKLYVDLDDVRGGGDVLTRMENKIRLEPSTCQVLAGHWGSGKSTELRRLARFLEVPKDNQIFLAVLVDVQDKIDLNDADIHELLAVIIRRVALVCKEQLNIELRPGYFKDRLNRIKDLLASPVSLGSLPFLDGLLQFSATIKESPNSRPAMRQVLEPDTNNWLIAANDVIAQAQLELQERGYSGLVIIVDGLDRMSTQMQSTGCTRAEYLFVRRADQLRSLGCHMVYAIPLQLAYSHQEQNLRALYGGHVPVIPMTKVRTQPPAQEPFEPGIERFRQIIKTRLASVEASESDLFFADPAKDIGRELVLLSGGQPREAMTLVREALVIHGRPIRSDALERCAEDMRRSYRRLLRQEYLPILEEIRKTGQPVQRSGQEAALRELLESRSILLYMNSEEWYALNPAMEAVMASLSEARD